MENIPKQVVFANLWPYPTNKQVLITRNPILLDYSSIVRNVGKVLVDPLVMSLNPLILLDFFCFSPRSVDPTYSPLCCFRHLRPVPFPVWVTVWVKPTGCPLKRVSKYEYCAVYERERTQRVSKSLACSGREKLPRLMHHWKIQSFTMTHRLQAISWIALLSSAT